MLWLESTILILIIFRKEIIMKSIKKNFKKALSLLCAVILIASTLAVMSVSTSAATISNDENVSASLETYEVWSSGFEKQEGIDYDYQTLGANTTRHVRGVAGATSTGHHIYSRLEGNLDADGNATGVIKFTNKEAHAYRGVMFNKVDTSSNAGVEYAYVIEANTTYTVSFDLKDSTSNVGVTYNFMGIAQQNTDTGYVLASWTSDQISSSYATYTATFTTPDDETLGDNKYLSFMILNQNSVAHNTWLDNLTIKKKVVAAPADVITFNDNGKTYYAYPDKLTALPDGDNGTLDSEFIAWVDADGNTVTEVPAAGTVLNAKYPVMTEIPDEEESVYLALTNTANKTLAGNDSKGTLGLSSSSGSSHDIYSRKTKLIDGTSTWIVKFAHTSTNAPNNKTYRSICFGKENTTADGLDNAYVLEPNTKYTVTYNILHESGANISFDLAAGISTKSTNGLVLDSNKPSSVISSWMTYTREFTTPDAETMGNQKYLLFVINNPALEVNVSWIYGVTITKFVAGDPADYISFVDGDKTYYTEVGDTAKLPKGQLAEGEERFLGWYDANGERVLEMPTEAGAVLTARYGVVKDGTVATSFREVSGTGSNYVSAGVRFRARLDTATVEAAEEVGFILVPNGNTVDSPLAIKGIAKNKNTHIIYDLTYDGFYDYQVIVTGLTREGVETNLCDLKIDVYFYYTLNGVTNFVGQPYTTSYNELTAGN